ncbi:hypothetical protein RAL92_25955 [Metapseudomonas otitidis]|uniref:hypothetical protein n=1 Tax=Metapseudomonas otitidis TaxID=319939 RepID=UPI0032180782
MKPQDHPSFRSPRDYAAAILAEPSKEGRVQLLERCPAHWREQVETHVRDAWGRLQAFQKYRKARHEAARQKPPSAPRQGVLNSVTNHTRSAPEVGNRYLSALRALVGEPHGN